MLHISQPAWLGDDPHQRAYLGTWQTNAPAYIKEIWPAWLGDAPHQPAYVTRLNSRGRVAALLLRRFCSRAAAAASPPPVESLLRILQSSAQRDLDAWPGRVTAALVKEVLHRLIDGAAVIRLLEWLETRPAFRHDNLTRFELLGALVRTGEHHRAYKEAAVSGCIPSRFIFQQMVVAFAMAGQAGAACEILREMVINHGLRPNVKVLNTAIRGLCYHGDATKLDHAMALFRELLELKLANAFSYTIVIKGCCDHGKLVEAEQLLLDMQQSKHCSADEFTFRTLLNGFCKAGHLDKAFGLVSEMIRRGYEPGTVGYNMLLNGLCKLARLNEAQELMKTMIERGYVLDAVTYTTVIDALCKAKEMSAVYHYFQQVTAPDVVLYTAIIHGICKAGKYREAFLLLDEMLSKGCKPSSITFNALFDGLCKIRKLDKAYQLLQELMKAGFVPDRFTYNIFIRAYAKVGNISKARRLFRQMTDKGLAPCNISYSSVMSAHCEASTVCTAAKYFDDMRSSGLLPDTVSFTTLVTSFAKTGRLEKARQLVAEMRNPSVITYNSLMDGYCRQNKLSDAFQLLNEMLANNCTPTVVTYNTLLKGLARCKQMNEAVKLLQGMSNWGYHPNLVTYTTLVRGLCRARKVVEAYQLLQEMSLAGYRPSGLTFRMLLHGLQDQETLRIVRESVLEMDDSDAPRSGIPAARKLVIYAVLVRDLCNLNRVNEAYQVLGNVRNNGCDPQGFVPKMFHFLRLRNHVTRLRNAKNVATAICIYPTN